ncbi:putative alpha,alpha-trehalose-phosphate synthase [UDP-forming] 11 [Morella rubra]|uniref:alpha,alpha-trehalose-phosphate synthase (UDP-forming) n=1 Tax=Morella rubra TaxID=262757 RepID=A0A6A1UWI0_9ROSI|nr:putative alpha,alpha-trehalose-phosphate synthase [UDP-forming] 11 [Morella rubra]
MDDFWSLNQVPPKVMRVPKVISRYGSHLEDDDGGILPRRIIVANELPIRALRDVETGLWSFEYDADSLYLQLRDGFGDGVEVVYVGCLKAEIDLAEQDRVAQELLDKFRCVPVFLASEIRDAYYHGFCKHYLWPLFHYMLPMTPSNGSRFDRALWQAYCLANKKFADKVTEVLSPEDDYVWIHNYHLMLLPTFLRKRFLRIKLGFFLHSPFPSSEIYRTIPVHKEILQALLNCDVIGFHTFDYARHFLTYCSRLLGLDYRSKRGYIGVEYCGRTVSIKILPAGIHMGQLESVLSRKETAEKVKELQTKFEGKIVMLGVDDMDIFKGINFKLSAMGQLLEEQEKLRGRVVLVQITNPARSQGKDIQDVESEVSAIAREINLKYGGPGYEPIVLLNGPVTTQEKAAYYAVAECCVVTPVRDGMNLVPYKYTVCRQGSTVLDKALGIDEVGPKKSVIIVSEFIGCSPSLSGAIRVNPWSIDDVCTAMYSAIEMQEAEKQLRHEKHYKYISSHDVAYWARSFDQDLVRACKWIHDVRLWTMGLGLGFKVAALSSNYKRLTADHAVSAYRRTNSRLILLDYDGTMMPKTCVDKTPGGDVISVLNSLCSDPKNTVFIVSGRGRDCLSKWFSPCDKLGISAEHGYFTRWTKHSSWETCTLKMDFDWKTMALPVMEHYTEATDGSFIEQKESALVWHYLHADLHFGSWQAKELLDHLENVLAKEPVEVKRGTYIIEVKPQGVSKGIAVENIISTLRTQGKSPDFVLCIGDDRSDEMMFEAIATKVPSQSFPAIREVFACCVGQKPSKAKCFLDDTDEVIKLLQGLAAESSIQAKSYPSDD